MVPLTFSLHDRQRLSISNSFPSPLLPLFAHLPQSPYLSAVRLTYLSLPWNIKESAACEPRRGARNFYFQHRPVWTHSAHAVQMLMCEPSLPMYLLALPTRSGSTQSQNSLSAGAAFLCVCLAARLLGGESVPVSCLLFIMSIKRETRSGG